MPQHCTLSYQPGRKLRHGSPPSAPYQFRGLLLCVLAFSSHLLQTSSAAVAPATPAHSTKGHTGDASIDMMNKGATMPGNPIFQTNDNNGYGMTGPPVNFDQLGQIAFLGQFDAMTPILSARQQNSYMQTSFSIVEIDTVYPHSPNNNASSTVAHIDNFSTYDSSSDTLPPISVPILLASFSMANLTDREKAEWGIKASCALVQAPHQIYIAGHFAEHPSSSLRSKDGVGMPSNSTTSGPHDRGFDRIKLTTLHGLNNIGVYDTQLKRFFSLDQGLDGPVYDLFCDSDANAVYAVGGFLAPVGLREPQPSASPPASPITPTESKNSEESQINPTSPQYGQLGAFGGGVAVWKVGSSNPFNSSIHPNSAPGKWAGLPFKGVNGILRAITRDQEGYLYFGGLFDTTTDGESSSAPDAQPVNLDDTVVTSGNGLPGPSGDQGDNILCQRTKQQRSNWLMQDNVPGYWRIGFPLHITPTLLRLWNVMPETGSASPTKGTQKFRVLAMPSNQPLNLSFVDPATMMVQYCVECILQPTWDTSQDFVIVEPSLVQALQVDILSWYGSGGGLGGFEVYQSEIFARGADNLNFPVDGCLTNRTPSTGQSTTTVNASSATKDSKNDDKNDTNDMKAYATHSGADWHTVTAPHGWQHVIAASIPTNHHAERSQAIVDMVPYLQEAGLYDVYLYTPRCTSTSPILPGNISFACDDRGSIDVQMYFRNAQEAVKITLSQTSTKDTAEKIYSGMIAASSLSFRPHVVIGPALSRSYSGNGKDRQTVIVDSIQFVKQATLDNANSLVLYRPPSVNPSSSEHKQNSSNVFNGIDGSSWRTLPKQLPFGSLIQSMKTYDNQVFFAGSFYASSYSNIVMWDTDDNEFVPLGRTPFKGVSSGLDANVSSGLAQYSITTLQWSEFGNVTAFFCPGARFETLELSADDQLIVRGNMTFLGDSESRLFAIWDLHQQRWLHEDGQVVQPNEQIAKRHPFGQVSGTVAYMHRFGLKDSVRQPPTLLIAGPLDSIDAFAVDKPSHIGWLNVQGALGATNLVSDDLTDRRTISDPSPISVYPPPAPPTNISPGSDAMAFDQINAGVVFFNKAKQTWHTIAGGRQGSRANAGIFSSAEGETTTQVKSFKALNGITDLQLQGEILALGLLKNSEDGSNDRFLNDEKEDGADLLLLGGAFQSLTPIKGLSGLAIYDLKNDQFVTDNMPSTRGFNGDPGVVKVIKSHPRNKALVMAGSFEGIGKDVDCPLVCVWDPAEARDAIKHQRDLKSSFKGFNGGKYKQSVRGTINDLVFADDKNMLVVGDLVIDGVTCGAANLNIDSATWSTYGSLAKVDIRPSASTANNHSNGTRPNTPIGEDTLFGPPTAIAHDVTFHRFFVAGRDSFTGAAYFKKWTGTRFIHISADFLPTSDVYQLELMAASDKAPIRGPMGSDGTKDHTDLSHIDAANDNSLPLSLAHAGDNDGLWASLNSHALDPRDTTQILEQGYILMVSGRIAISRTSNAKVGELPTIWYQEAGVAFFDGQSWFPFLQSSGPTLPATKTSHVLMDGGGSGLDASPTAVKRAVTPQKHSKAIAYTNYYRQLAKAGLLPLPTQLLSKFVNPSQGPGASRGARQHGIFRALAFQHLPRIIAREYLALPFVILISICVSLSLVFLIVLVGFVYAWLKRRLSKDPDNIAAFTFTRPRSRPDSTCMEDDAAAMFAASGKRSPRPFRSHYHSGSNTNTWSAATGSAELRQTLSSSQKENTEGGSRFGLFSKHSEGASAKKKQTPGSAASLLTSLGIAEALDRNRDDSFSTHHNNSAGSVGAGAGVASGAMAGSPQPSRRDLPYRTAIATGASKRRASPPLEGSDRYDEKAESSQSLRSPTSSHRRRRSAVTGSALGTPYCVEELQRIRRQEEDLARSLSGSGISVGVGNGGRTNSSRSACHTRLSIDQTPTMALGSSASLGHIPTSASTTPPPGSTPPLGGTGAAASRPAIVYRPNSTLAEATGALVSEFVRSHQRQLGRSATFQQSEGGDASDRSQTPSPKKRKQQQQQSRQTTPTKAATASDTSTSAPAPSQRPNPPDRDSSNSDLLNPIASGHFSTVNVVSSGSPLSVRSGAQGPTSTPRSVNRGSRHVGDRVGDDAVVGDTQASGGSGGSGSNVTDTEAEGSAAVEAETVGAGGEAGGRGSLASSMTGGIIYYAKYPFRAREIGELGFSAGEKILVVDNSDDIWWMGVIQDENGQQIHGVFPSNYVGSTP
ncbi:hypothetical protein BGZ73_007787 [Actinomortierella ambigua]|nr:hypothetical protein BGZ73_007787 [Actinomortierella ambigua]